MVRVAHRAVLLLIAAVFCGGCVGAAGKPVRALTIVHTNDLHARLLPDARGRGGFAEIAATIRQACRGAAACLVMDGGDLVQGSPVSSLFEGVPIFEIANQVGLDVSTLGNHEFDYGWQKISQFTDAADFLVLNANLSHPDGGRLGDGPSTVITTENGIRVGVVGALTETLPHLVAPEQLGSWTARPVVESLEDIIFRLNEETDVVIVLGHLTPEEEQALNELPGVDFVISGHDHSGLVEPIRDDDSAILRVRAYGVQVGRLEMTVDVEADAVTSWSWEALPVDGSIAPDTATFETVQAWEQRVSEIVDIELAVAARDYDRDEMKLLFERALAEETGAEVTYINRGGVRDVFLEGTLLARHVWNAMPFEDFIVSGTFRGSELPRFLREERGLDPDREYRFASIDFVVSQWRRHGQADLDVEHGELFRDLLLRWVGERERLD